MALGSMGQKIPRRAPEGRVRNHRLSRMNWDRTLVVLRQFSNYGLVVVALFGLFVNMRWGLALNLVLSALCVPYYIRIKLWDTVFFIAFMSTVNLVGLIAGVPGCKVS